jgi:hypothetical protein
MLLLLLLLLPPLQWRREKACLELPPPSLQSAPPVGTPAPAPAAAEEEACVDMLTEDRRDKRKVVDAAAELESYKKPRTGAEDNHDASTAFADALNSGWDVCASGTSRVTKADVVPSCSPPVVTAVVGEGLRTQRVDEGIAVSLGYRVPRGGVGAVSLGAAMDALKALEAASIEVVNAHNKLTRDKGMRARDPESQVTKNSCVQATTLLHGAPTSMLCKEGNACCHLKGGCPGEKGEACD